MKEMKDLTIFWVHVLIQVVHAALLVGLESKVARLLAIVSAIATAVIYINLKKEFENENNH